MITVKTTKVLDGNSVPKVKRKVCANCAKITLISRDCIHHKIKYGDSFTMGDNTCKSFKMDK